MKLTEFGGGVFTISNVLARRECRGLIDESERRGYEGATIQSTFGENAVPEVRNNERIIFEDWELARRYFDVLKPFLPRELDSWGPSGLNEKFRFYKYTESQYFKWHVDGSFKRDYFEVSKLSLLLYLNDTYVGGETEFENCKIEPSEGLALIFPHKLRHQGCAVSSGIKYMLRTDVMYAR